MLHHLYLHTPPHRDSDYFAHLIEHCAMGKISDAKQYFQNRKITADCYTYYTHYSIDTSSDSELNAFFDQLCQPIPESLIRYEAKVLRQECQSRKYFQSLISRIGQKLYGEKFSYSASQKLNIADLQAYHTEHYQRAKIIVLNKNLEGKDIGPTGFNYESSLSVRLRWENEFVVVAPYSPESFFVNEIFQDLLDEYITYHSRYELGEYFSNDTLAGEFEEHVFLSIDRRNLGFLSAIPPEFISIFIQHTLESLDTVDQHEIDGPLMLKYGYTLSEKSKKVLIGNLFQYYETLRTNWLRSKA